MQGTRQFRNCPRGVQSSPTTTIDRKCPLGKGWRPPAQRPQIASRNVPTRMRRQSILATGWRANNACERFCQARPVLPNMRRKPSRVSHQDAGRYHCTLLPVDVWRPTLLVDEPFPGLLHQRPNCRGTAPNSPHQFRHHYRSCRASQHPRVSSAVLSAIDGAPLKVPTHRPHSAAPAE